MHSALSGNHSVLKVILGFMLLVLVCVGSCMALMVIHCEYLNTLPEAPVYPQSTLVDQVSRGVGTSKRPMITYYYMSPASPEEIIAFYERDSCRKNEGWNRVTCQGEAKPFGEYFAYIDLASYVTENKTPYVLEVRWRGCTWELE